MIMHSMLKSRTRYGQHTKEKKKKKVIKYKCRRHRGIGEQTARIKRSAEEDKPQTSQ